MKEGWKMVKLGEIAKHLRDGSHNPPKGVEKSSYLMLSSKNVFNDSFSLNSPRYLSKEDFDIEDKRTKLKIGDILVTIVGTIGRVCLFDKSEKITLQRSVAAITPIESVCSRYLMHCLISMNLEELAQGAAQKGLYLKQLANIEIPLPPLSEQTRIVSLLDDAFEKLERSREKALKLLDDAKEIFQAQLKKEMTPKEGWEVKKIGDVCEIKGGKRVPKGYKLKTEKTNYPYIRVTDFCDEGTVALDDIHYIDEEVFNQIKRYIITTDDVYVSIAGTIGKCGIIPTELNGANLTENACRLILDKCLFNRFLLYYFRTEEFKQESLKAARTTSQPKLSLNRLAEIQIPLPPLSEQSSIVSRLDVLSSQLKQIEEKTNKYLADLDELKQSLLKKAFEGKL